MNPCKFINQAAIERLTIAALGPEPTNGVHDPNKWTAFLRAGTTQAEKIYKKRLATRIKICNNILHDIFSQHTVDNAFFKVSFSNNKRGLMGASAVDLMHAVEEGIIPYLLEIVLDPLSEGLKEKVDQLADEIFYYTRATMREDFPRFAFTNGFSSLTLLTADEKLSLIHI